MFIIIILAILLGYAFIGGILARITWPLQKRIDKRAKAKNSKAEVSSWREHLCFCFFLWPAVIIAYFFLYNWIYSNNTFLYRHRG